LLNQPIRLTKNFIVDHDQLFRVNIKTDNRSVPDFLIFQRLILTSYNLSSQSNTRPSSPTMTESAPLLGPNEDPSGTDRKPLLTRLFRRPRRQPTPSAESDDEAAGTEVTEQDSDTRRAKGHRQRCFECCQGWYQHICFSKWYKWTAYYIPILEWLPSYKCPFPPLIWAGKVDFW